MIALYIFGKSMVKKIRIGWKDAEFRGMFWSVLLVVGFGTVFYHEYEKWSWVDSFYFTVVTLTTVGYGDLSPTLPLTKLFTVVYLIVGVGLISSFIIKLATMPRLVNLPLPANKELPTEAAESDPMKESAMTTGDQP